MPRSFILISVATYLTLVTADDLQELNCTGKKTVHSITTNLCAKY